MAVNRRTGEIKVERVCVAHDCGQLINPDGTVNQVEGGVIQTVSRTLMPCGSPGQFSVSVVVIS
jgi:nicotinate dehydrogenase subunit B